MDRRGFFSSLVKATVGATVAYSFPSIIVPKNIIPVTFPIQPTGQDYWSIFLGKDFGGGKVFTWFNPYTHTIRASRVLSLDKDVITVDRLPENIESSWSLLKGALPQ